LAGDALQEMLASSRIGADEDINDYEGKTEEEINELMAAKVRVEDLVTPSLFFACHELIYSCNKNCILKVLTNKKKAG
jgi:hypothetical protein